MSDSKRAANSLVAMSSAAVLVVYAAGYLRTRAAADKLESAGRRAATEPPPMHGEPPAMPESGPARAAAEQPAIGFAISPLPSSATSTPHEPVRHERHRAEARIEEPKAPAGAAGAAANELQATTASRAEATVTGTADPLPAAPVATAAAAATTAADPAPKPADPPAPEAPKPSPYKDGTYYGWGTSRHGSIQAAVTIESGRIMAATIAQCLTRYSCSWIAHLPPQVVSRQSPNVDYVSGATQSTYAFYDAVVEALSKAK